MLLVDRQALQATQQSGRWPPPTKVINQTLLAVPRLIHTRHVCYKHYSHSYPILEYFIYISWFDILTRQLPEKHLAEGQWIILRTSTQVHFDFDRLLYHHVLLSSFSVAERRQQPPTNHRCYKNWSSSSKAMEADIIAEGFHQAESMHGVRYMTVVGDGDSFVMSTLQDPVSRGPHVT